MCFVASIWEESVRRLSADPPAKGREPARFPALIARGLI
jgi:hypothetical protein